MDRFSCYADLARVYSEQKDFRIRYRHGCSGIAIIAPHGGWIERGTVQIAEAIAGDTHGFYCFEGLNRARRRDLHITSNNFEEPRAMSIARRSFKVVTIHGAKGTDAAVFGGGLDRELRDRILRRLSAAGFAATTDPSPTRQGTGIRNICNRGRTGAGVQLELTVGLRKELYRQDADGHWIPAPALRIFVSAVRDELLIDPRPGEIHGASLRRSQPPDSPRE